MRKRLFSLTMAILLMMSMMPSTSNGHKIFEKEFEKAYKELDVNASCTLCHVAKEEKTVRNDFGKLFAKEFEGQEFSKKWNEMERDGQKVYEKEEMAPAFQKALKKIKEMKNKDGATYESLIKEFKMEGVKQKKKKK